MPGLLTKLRRMLLGLNADEKALIQTFGSPDIDTVLKQHKTEKQQQLAAIKEQTRNKTGTVRTGSNIAGTDEETLTAQAIIHFRRHNNYNGEYGFDWMRTDEDKHDNRQTAYTDICGYYDYSISNENPIFKKDTNSYKQLEIEYHTLDISWQQNENYYVPWLSIAESQTVTLNLQVDIQQEPQILQLDYNKEYFVITPETITDKVKGKRILKDAIKIQCIKDFSEHQTINIKDENNQPAGRLLVWHNLPKRKLKLSWVLVLLNKEDKREIEKIMSPEKLNQWLNEQGINQALLKTEIEFEYKILDLIADYEDIKAKYMTVRQGIKIENDNVKFEREGECIIWPTEFSQYLINQFNIQYTDVSNNLICFFVNIEAKKIKYDIETDQYIITGDQNGNAIGIGANQLLMYKTGLNKNAINHEVLHCLGLYHSFGDSKTTDQQKKHIFEKNQTENLMDYVKDENSKDRRKSLWKWQWEIIINNKKTYT